jgi:hypothetical protein
MLVLQPTIAEDEDLPKIDTHQLHSTNTQRENHHYSSRDGQKLKPCMRHPFAFTGIPATGFVGDPANTLSVPTFSGINSYAEAYFGGLGIVGVKIADQYTDKDGYVVYQTSTPSGVVISLTTPFIYAPERSTKGETGDGRACIQTGGTENYGYIPQTVLDYLIANQYYSAQYLGLESCLPGGPSILQE